MKDEPESKGFTIGGTEMAVLTLVFVALKLGPVPEMPWAVVLFPLWFPFALSVFALILMAVFGILFALGAVAYLIWDGVAGLWKGGGK